MRGKLLADDGAATTRITGWTTSEAKPLPVTPNLLADNPMICSLIPSGDWGGVAHFSMDPKTLWDGKVDPPEEPWIGWNFISFFAETSPINYVLLDAFRRQLRVEAITFFEDPSRPSSWLRDAKFEYWDAAREKWVTACHILADDAVHTHKLANPAEAARFRVLLPWGCVGNLRLAEIVLHGESLGCSHPDLVARKPVAVLFDEQDDIKNNIFHEHRAKFNMDKAYSGGRSIEIVAGPAMIPIWKPYFGHAMPDWDFEIVEDPKPGQYRWLQFAWKAASPETKTINLSLWEPGEMIASFYAGDSANLNRDGIKLGDRPPAEWHVERVDLWKAFGGKNGRVQTFSLESEGGNALIDQIILGASGRDLDAYGRDPTTKRQ
jgi:hypothetical protein